MPSARSLMMQWWTPLVRLSCISVWLLFVLAVAPPLPGQSLAPQPPSDPAESTADKVAEPVADPDFVRDILPIFKARCYACHSASRQEGDFRLDLRRSAFAPASSGSIPVVPGDVERSSLLEQIQGDSPAMPADGEPLSLAQQQQIQSWIAQGAPWPDAVAGEETSSAPSLWSLQPLAATRLEDVPSVADSPIDQLVMQKLAAMHLELSPPAARSVLIRRLYLDMLGLPPTPEQTRAFVMDDRPDAYERVVENLLANPRFGERWGRHWLDVVRFAETTGFETNVDRPNAYHYRDWVIESINSDLPFDQFAAAQVAGDQLGHDVATGFLVAGAWDQVKSPDVNLTLMQREDELADMVGTTSTTFFGLTLGCARCHQHKFDPLSQTDYYALKAILAGTQHGDRRLKSPNLATWEEEQRRLRLELANCDQTLMQSEPLANVDSKNSASADQPARQSTRQRMPVNARQNIDRFSASMAKYIRFHIQQTNQSEPCIDELEVWSVDEQGNLLENVALQSKGAILRSSGNFADTSKHRLELANDGRSGNDSSWISNESGKGWLEVELPTETRVGVVRWGRDQQSIYQDRVAVRYEISLGIDANSMSLVASSEDRLPFTGPGQSATQTPPQLAAHDEGRETLLRQRSSIEERLQQLRRQMESAGLVYAGNFVAAPEIHRLYRGEPQSPREVVSPNIPQVLGQLPIDANAPESERRLALAHWLGNPDNRLVARVIANRIWQHHFGRGIVATPNDFGTHGAPPTHPELLDWLAQQLIDHQWSMKHLHRTILLSQTYRQANLPRDEGLKIDHESRYLWRYPPRRLEAEAIRDSILAVAGGLDLSMGGPGFSSFEPNSNYVRVYLPKKSFEAIDFRRMIYMTRVRMVPDPTFGSFDSPDGGLTCPVRSRSTTPIQAFQLLNSPFVMEQAQRFAIRLGHECEGDRERSIERAFVLALGRLPTDMERQQSLELVDRFGIPALTRSLLNTNEFLLLP